mmetsp:Transcript_11515/g.12684  ORF Transcript_11515/g.12684 Transcript_11515/m.12684 type:complete len:103 (-) Transcript_11515:255-563(-)
MQERILMPAHPQATDVLLQSITRCYACHYAKVPSFNNLSILAAAGLRFTPSLSAVAKISVSASSEESTNPSDTRIAPITTPVRPSPPEQCTAIFSFASPACR